MEKYGYASKLNLSYGIRICLALENARVGYSMFEASELLCEFVHTCRKWHMIYVYAHIYMIHQWPCLCGLNWGSGWGFVESLKTPSVHAHLYTVTRRQTHSHTHTHVGANTHSLTCTLHQFTYSSLRHIIMCTKSVTHGAENNVMNWASESLHKHFIFRSFL